MITDLTVLIQGSIFLVGVIVNLIKIVLDSARAESLLDALQPIAQTCARVGGKRNGTNAPVGLILIANLVRYVTRSDVISISDRWYLES